MLVTELNFDEVVSRIMTENFISLDTETTGLNSFKDSELFSIIIGTKDEVFYFNFHRESVDAISRDKIALLSPLFLNVLRTVFLANAKFDMHMLAREGITKWKCTVHDVLVVERLIYNDDMKYSLDAVAKKYGMEKDASVEEYIKENKLYTMEVMPGKKTKSKNLHYDKVPQEIIQPYAEKDARITYDIGMRQLAKFEKLDCRMLDIEREVTKICFEMEREGIHVNEEEVSRRCMDETAKYEATAREFMDKTGQRLIDSAKALGPVFSQAGFRIPKTDKGADSLTDDFLSEIKHPLGDMLIKYRHSYKLANTYYRNFLWMKDKDGKIHADMKQAGTKTGRFSYGVPNLQNVPVGEVREVFVPPRDFCFVAIDFAAQEYRLMLDYAAQADLIEKVRNGLDVHTATAELMKVDRKYAKTLGFMLLYGGGIVKLCLSLYPVSLSEKQLWAIWREYNEWKLDPEDANILTQITLEEKEKNIALLLDAQKLRALYFEKLPKVQNLIERVIGKAKITTINTWAGRTLHFKKPFAYKAPNALIQGGCADIMKIAMIKVHEFLLNKKSKMLLSIHDELLFAIHKDELDIVPRIKELMENVYPHVYLPMTCSVEYSWKNWGDMTDGFPLQQ